MRNPDFYSNSALNMPFWIHNFLYVYKMISAGTLRSEIYCLIEKRAT